MWTTRALEPDSGQAFIILWGFFWANFFTEAAGLRSELPSTQHRIDRGAENDGEPRLKGLLGVVLGLFGVVGDVVPLFLQLLDRALAAEESRR